MIRVERGPDDGHGMFDYWVRGLGLHGRSRQPLLDACRRIKRMGGDTGATAGLFREGRSEPDATCSVEWGAAHTVKEPSRGNIGFAKWHPFGERSSSSEKHNFGKP